MRAGAAVQAHCHAPGAQMRIGHKYGFGPMKDDINFVAGWSIGRLAAEAISKAGAEPTREKLIELLSKGFEVDTRGAPALLKFTLENRQGPVQLRAYTYDYTSKRFKAQGSYADSVKYGR